MNLLKTKPAAVPNLTDAELRDLDAQLGDPRISTRLAGAVVNEVVFRCAAGGDRAAYFGRR